MEPQPPGTELAMKDASDNFDEYVPGVVLTWLPISLGLQFAMEVHAVQMQYQIFQMSAIL